MNATKTTLDARTRSTLSGKGPAPISRSEGIRLAAEDGYTLAGSTGAVSLRRADESHVGTYSTVRGALRALVADEAGCINRDRRAPQPRARHD